VVQLTQLRYLLEVAETRHFTRAARNLHVAQPSLSQQIRLLERELGAALFVRARGGVTLTEAGAALLPVARRVLADLDGARREVQEITQLRRGRVRVGGTPSLCQGVLAEVLRAFAQRWPGIEPCLAESGTSDLAERLRLGELDVALLILPVPSALSAVIAFEPLVREELVIVSGTGQLPPGERGVCTPADLRERPLVLPRHGYALREHATGLCRAAGFEPTIAVDGGELDAVIALVRCGAGLALLPAIAARRAALTVTRLAEPAPQRTIGLAWRRDAGLSRAAQEFRAILLEQIDHAPATDVTHRIAAPDGHSS